MGEEIFEWILSRTNIELSFNASDAVTVFNSESNQKDFFVLVEISVRGLHNDMIKFSENGRFDIVY